MLNNGLNLGVLSVDASSVLKAKPSWRPAFYAPDPVPSASAESLNVPAFKPDVSFCADPVPARSA